MKMVLKIIVIFLCMRKRSLYYYFDYYFKHRKIRQDGYIPPAQKYAVAMCDKPMLINP